MESPAELLGRAGADFLPGVIMAAILDYKIEVFIPPDFVELLRDELAKIGVGRIGYYDHCISVMQVRGYWRPLSGANPYAGTVGEIASGEEAKVEVNLLEAQVTAALKVIRRVHPYEEPVINVIPLANRKFLSGEAVH
jgi:hypothetical protein